MRFARPSSRIRRDARRRCFHREWPGATCRAAAACLLLVLAASSVAAAQDPPKRIRELVSFETNSAIAKKFAGAQEHLNARQWPQAIDVLADIADSHPEAVISVAAGRYVNVALHCQLILAGLPPEALAAYRRKVDPQAQQWLAAGRLGDDAMLERILRQAFASSLGDDAADLLAERAWDRGDFEAARRYWEMLLPLNARAEPGTPVATLSHPDATLSRPEVLARLVLCSLFEGSLDRAQSELAAFARQAPEAEGRLAGRTGNLAEILTAIVAAESKSAAPADDVAIATFAGSPRRSLALPESVKVGTRQWGVSLPKLPFVLPTRRPALRDAGPACYYPVVHGDTVFVGTSEEIFAWDILTGKPAWPGMDPSGRIEPPEAIRPPADPVGVPRFTLTVDDGRLYARMGTPVTSQRRGEIAELRTKIVCLDVARLQGKPLWSRVADDDFGSGWAFEGTPVVDRGRVYVVLRKSQPQTQLNIACLDGTNEGRLLWNRKVCSVVAPQLEGRNVISHHLLCLDDGTLYLSTDLGAVIAVDARDGSLRWGATYESHEAEHEIVLSDPLVRGLLPCAAWGGLVVAAPNDYRGVMAFDARTGSPAWERRLNVPARHVLGVTPEGLLIVSSDRLSGIDMQTGRVVWETPDDSSTYGRGIIAGEFVYWPLREEVVIVRHGRSAQNRIESRVPLKNLHGEWGGNLIIARDHLLIAGPDRLVAFGDYVPVKEGAKKEISARPSDPRPLLRLARAEQGSGETESALAHYRRAAELGTALGTEAGRSQAAAARRRLSALLGTLADGAWKSGDLKEAARRVSEAAAATPDPAQRASLMLTLAELQRGDKDRAAATWRTILADRRLGDEWLQESSVAGRPNAPGQLLSPARRMASDALRKIETKGPGEPPERGEPLRAAHSGRSPPWRRAWEQTLATPRPGESRVLMPGGRGAAGAPRCVLTCDSSVRALRLDDGRELWSLPLAEQILFAQHSGDRLVLGSPRRLTAVETSSGRTVWDTAIEPESASRAASPRGSFFVPAGGELVCQTARGMTAFQLLDGEAGWRWDSRLLAGPPALSDGRLLFQESGKAIAISFAGEAPSTSRGAAVTERWATTPAACRKLAVVAAENKRVYGLDATGRPLWTFFEGVSWTHADPKVLTNGETVLVVIDGSVLVRLSPQSGKTLWRRPLCRRANPRAAECAAIAEDRLYAVGDGILRCISLGDGRTVWEQPVGDPDMTWTVHAEGTSVIAWPERSDGRESQRVVVAEPTTGRLVQRLRPSVETGESAPVAVHPGDGALVLSAGRLSGFRPY